MNTRIISLQNQSAEEEDKLYKEAGQIIRNGGLVAFPTETVYGLGANALNAEASAKIYAAKGRPSDNPLIAHIAKRSQLDMLAKEVPHAAELLMEKFWPGPLTLIFPKKECVPYGTTGGLDTVAVRMPNHPVARRLILEAGVPIAAPSANLSGKPSPTNAAHTADDMNGRIDMILDGGACELGLESTIVNLCGEIPTILRPGFITYEMLEHVLGNVAVDKALDPKEWKNFRPQAPGQKYTHYAPDAPLTLIEGEIQAVVEKINEMTQQAVSKGLCVGIICTEETKNQYPLGIVKSMGVRSELTSIAHNLYEILREFNETGVQVIYSEAFPDKELGNAVMNRLVKAAGHKEIQV